VFGYNQNTFRVWAPNQWTSRPNPNGRIINVGLGWGNENYAAQQNTADVRVTVTEEVSADFDSGWLTLSAAQSTPNCFLDLPHALGGYPGYVCSDGNWVCCLQSWMYILLCVCCSVTVRVFLLRLAFPAGESKCSLDLRLAFTKDSLFTAWEQLKQTTTLVRDFLRRVHGRNASLRCRLCVDVVMVVAFLCVSAASEGYGGVLYGYNSSSIRLWLPSNAASFINTAGFSVCVEANGP
jgi:hypothetical protein